MFYGKINYHAFDLKKINEKTMTVTFTWLSIFKLVCYSFAVNLTLSICQRIEGDIENGATFLAETPFILLKVCHKIYRMKTFA